MFRFTIRELVLLTIIVACIGGWARDRLYLVRWGTDLEVHLKATHLALHNAGFDGVYYARERRFELSRRPSKDLFSIPWFSN